MELEFDPRQPRAWFCPPSLQNEPSCSGKVNGFREAGRKEKRDTCLLNQLLQTKGTAVALGLTTDQGCSLLCETQNGQVKGTSTLESPRALSGREMLSFPVGRESCAAFMRLESWGGVLRVSEKIHPNYTHSLFSGKMPARAPGSTGLSAMSELPPSPGPLSEPPAYCWTAWRSD